MLNIEAVRGSKAMISFEIDTKELRHKLAKPDLRTKIEGLADLLTVLSNCYNYRDQL